MSRPPICLAIGLACVLVGAVLTLFAAELAGSPSLSAPQPGEWGYYVTGLAFLSVGLLLEALACSRWLSRNSGET